MSTESTLPFQQVEAAIARSAERFPGSPLQEVTLLRLYFYLLPRIQDHLNANLKPLGLSDTLFMALMVLYTSEHQRVQPSLLSTSLGFSRTNATRVADDLVRRGWATREECSTDRRCIHLRLTEAGTACVHKVLPAHRQYLRDMWSCLTVQEQQTLETLLRKLLVSIDG